MIGFVLSFVVFVVCIGVAAQIARKAIAALSAEHKAQLVDLSLADSKRSLILMVLLFGGWFAVAYLQRQYFAAATLGLLVAVLLAFVVNSIRTWQRFRQAGFPPSFLSALVRSRVLRLIGATLFFAAGGARLLGY